MLLFFSGALLLPLEGVILNFYKMPKYLKNYRTLQMIIIFILLIVVIILLLVAVFTYNLLLFRLLLSH